MLGCVFHASRSLWIAALRSDGRCKSLEVFSIPCPGCHGTRSLIALCRGDLVLSLKENILPSIVLGFCVLWVLSPKRFDAVFQYLNAHWRVALLGAFAVILAQWLINICRFYDLS